jgi:hypothetical protein
MPRKVPVMARSWFPIGLAGSGVDAAIFGASGGVIAFVISPDACYSETGGGL